MRRGSRSWLGTRGVLWILLAAVFLLQFAPATRASEAAANLARRLDRVLQSSVLKGAVVSVLVVREASGEVVFEREPDLQMIPASNQKILTALAVLDAFGPSHRFVTGIYADALPDKEGRVQRLFIRGGGDPAINSEDWWRLAVELRTAGLRRVEGDLILDDSALDGERWHPGLNGISSRAYHAPVGALNANYGSFTVMVGGGDRPGDPVRVAINPPIAYLKVSDHARTISAGKRRKLIVDRTGGPAHEVVTLRGTVPAGDEAKAYYRSVRDPLFYAGSVLRMQLAANGIDVAGELRRGLVPERAVELHQFEGRSLAEIVRLLMKYSNNAIAETLVKNLGALASGGVGSWESGVAELERRLGSLGLDTKRLEVVDGSGLSYENRVSSRILVEALRNARSSFQFGPELLASLPIASRDGTLEKRAEGAVGRVRAKTGLLNQVSALSGFALLPQNTGIRAGTQVAAPEAEQVVFSILINGYRGTDEAVMDVVDEFLATLTAPK